MKRLAYLSVLPIFGVFFMAFSVEKVVDYQEVEESSKYFKIVRGEKIKIIESDMSKLSTLRLMDEEVQLLIGFNKLSTESIENAKDYFKNYGFTLKVVYIKVDNKSKLTNIELSLLEDDKANKQKNRSRNYEMYNDGGRFDLVEYRELSKEDKGMLLSITANKKTGIHTVSLAHIPPSPPKIPVPTKPPLSPKAPPVPLLSPKVGLKNVVKNNSEDLIARAFADAYDGTRTTIHIPYKKINYLIFEGNKLQRNVFISRAVTQKDWQSYLDFLNTDNYFSKEFRSKMIPNNWKKIIIKSDKSPVEFVSPEQANEYCKWKTEFFNSHFTDTQKDKKYNYQEMVLFNSKNRKEFKFRLPNEKEWQSASDKKIIRGDKFKSIGFYYILEKV